MGGGFARLGIIEATSVQIFDDDGDERKRDLVLNKQSTIRNMPIDEFRSKPDGACLSSMLKQH